MGHEAGIDGRWGVAIADRRGEFAAPVAAIAMPMVSDRPRAAALRVPSRHGVPVDVHLLLSCLRALASVGHAW